MCEIPKNVLDHLEKRRQSTIDVKFFDILISFTGREISQCRGSITIPQTGYTERTLTKYNLLNANGVYTPLPTNANLLPASAEDTPLSESEHARYRTVLGKLLHLAACTRANICFRVSALARQVIAVSKRHEQYLKSVLRYFITTKGQGITCCARKNDEAIFTLEAFLLTHTGLAEMRQENRKPVPFNF